LIGGNNRTHPSGGGLERSRILTNGWGLLCASRECDQNSMGWNSKTGGFLIPPCPRIAQYTIFFYLPRPCRFRRLRQIILRVDHPTARTAYVHSIYPAWMRPTLDIIISLQPQPPPREQGVAPRKSASENHPSWPSTRLTVAYEDVQLGYNT
jgi:hypothetical protein